MHRHTLVYWGRYHLTKARITPRDTEGRLQRSFLWDKSIFDGGWWALDRHEWEAVLGKRERWSMVPSQQWDTKPRERLKQTRGTGECEETGSGKIVCQCWYPWQRLIVHSGFSTWLTPYIQTWKEMQQKFSSETPDFIFFQTECGYVDEMKSSKDTRRIFTEAAGGLSISSYLLSSRIVDQICTDTFMPKCAMDN